MKKTVCMICACMFALFVFAGCGGQGGAASGGSLGSGSGIGPGGGDAPEDAGRLQVVATIFPEYDFARAVSGGEADVSLLIAPGASVHSFDPSPGDIKTIAAADVFVYVGGESDEWVVRILDGMDTDGMRVVRLMDYVEAVPEELAEGMEPEDEEEEEEEEGAGPGDAEAGAGSAGGGAEEEEEEELDEHVWVSPKNAMALLDAIAGAMAEADPANAEAYAANAEAYRAQLAEVDAEIAAVCDAGARRKIIVADKFPFRYFTDHYGLDYAAAFPGCSDQADAAPKTIAFLIDAVKNEGIPCVYYTELSNRSVAEAVAEETGARMLLLNSCENITKDDFESGVTYADLMRANAATLKEGLG